MYHQHYQEIDSTQKELLKIADQEGMLISATKQNNGVGRTGNPWNHFGNNLAFSFSLKPASPITLTPLEIGVALCQFFQVEYNKELALKWPNDLMDPTGKKCGGIICNYINENLVVVGIGINWGANDSNFGQVFEHYQLETQEYKNIPVAIFNSIIHNRLSSKDIIEQWSSKCIHLNAEVRIDNSMGIFTGIGENGEAILDYDRKFISGSLFKVSADLF